MNTHRTILARCGWALIAVGLVNIGILIYSVITSSNYSSGYGMLAVPGGYLLIRGSLKAARIIAFLSALLISALMGLMLATLILIPNSLIVTYWTLEPEFVTVSTFLILVSLVMLAFLYKQLTSPPVRKAMERTGVAHLFFLAGPNLGFLLGCMLAAVLFIALFFILGGPIAEQAKRMARDCTGPGYQFFVRSLNVSSVGRRKSVQAVIIAYSDSEIKTVSIEWSE